MAESNSELVVESFKLTKIYNNRQIALNDVTLRLEPGCVLGLLGSNGAGKTTLLRLIIGLHRPTAGWAKVFGKVMTPNSADLRRRIGYIPTNPQFPRGMTPITYLDYMARLFGLPAEVRKPRLASLIRAVDLLPHSGSPIAGFSNGMTARLAVATSLINEPDLLIWDEPTHGLDPEARRSMLELIKTLAAEKTLIVSSHNLSDIDEVCNHAAVLSHGQLIYCGSLQDLKGRMRRNHYELDLEGEQKGITKAVGVLRGLSDFSNMKGNDYRVALMGRQIALLFGRVPDTLDDFVLASQISQAEALKFFIEWFRQGKWRRTGLLWWNLRDGWPVISDAIVDYYNRKKLAYMFVKRVQANLCAICGEASDGLHPLIVVNDTRIPDGGLVRVTDLDRGRDLLQESFEVPANGLATLGHVPVAKKFSMWKITWTHRGGADGLNHYLAGPRPFALEDYRWLKQLTAIA